MQESRVSPDTLPRFESALPRTFFSPKAVTKPAKQTDWRAVAVTAILTTGFVVIATHQEPISRSAAPLPVSTPQPVPTLAPAERAPRAQLVGPTVRRAEFVNYPIGFVGPVTMPDGSQTQIRYMGNVPSFGQLPRAPHLADMYGVTQSGHSWIWMMPAGFARPAWVDP